MMSALHAVHALEQGRLNIELKTCLSSQSPEQSSTPKCLSNKGLFLAIVLASKVERLLLPSEARPTAAASPAPEL
jgi:hypothetical protein